MLDYLFYAWLLGMWVWNFILWIKNDYLGSFYPTCNDAANFYADIYRYLGYFFIGVLIIGLFALLCAKIRPKDDLGAGLGNNFGAPTNNYGNPALDVYGSQMGAAAGKGNPVYCGDKFNKVR